MLGFVPNSVCDRSIIVRGREERKESQAAWLLLPKRPLSPQRVTVGVGEKMCRYVGNEQLKKGSSSGNNRKVENVRTNHEISGWAVTVPS